MGSGLANCISDDTNCAALRTNMQLCKPAPGLSREGIKKWGNYAALHITSRRFDEPSCLELLSTCSFVIAIHGCVGGDERVLLGGLVRRIV